MGVRFRLPVGTEAEAAERLLRQHIVSAHTAFALDSGLLPKAKERRSVHDATGKAAFAPEHMVQKFFQTLVKTNGLHEAHDVANHYLPSGGSGITPARRRQALEEFRSMAASLGKDELVIRMDRLVKEARHKEDEDAAQENEKEMSRIRQRAEGVAGPTDAPPSSRPRLS